MKLKPLSQIFIIVGGLIVLILLIFFFVIFPIFDSIQENGGVWVQDQKRLLAFGRSEHEIAKLTDEVSKINEINPLVQSTLINEDETITFIVALENIGKALTLSYDINIGSGTLIGRGVSALGFQVSLNGPFVSVARFIEAVENMPHYTKINSINISRRGSEVSALINISAFINQ